MSGSEGGRRKSAPVTRSNSPTAYPTRGAASGLGREFRLSMSFFPFTDVALILLVYFLLVVVGDAASAGLRRLAR